MADKDNDPAAAWQAMFGEMSKGFTALASQAMATPEIAKAVGQVGGATAEAQKQFGEMVEKYLAGLNLPTRAQMDEFGARLSAIEARLDQLKAAVDQGRNESGDTTAPKPTRAK
ncbi:poly(R)-hydroxyalkanoic acid synthase subunit PhaE [Rhodopseudomonas palustris]|uniref:poly(R)-hydroxyalkanoic acid synthase subunit PhaE n=1 Tax=Rhodopseudomonas palustris TaxID=1076 RepID=UPI000319A84F|nr:poly(R)-hydroxyalkanoic acid synthase subunit PhaE [Rhodopseudomonas palustris]